MYIARSQYDCVVCMCITPNLGNCSRYPRCIFLFMRLDVVLCVLDKWVEIESQASSILGVRVREEDLFNLELRKLSDIQNCYIMKIAIIFKERFFNLE